MGIRSEIIPKKGLDRAATAVDIAMATLHVELPVNVMPRNELLSPRASWNKATKYTGKMAAMPDVA